MAATPGPSINQPRIRILLQSPILKTSLPGTLINFKDVSMSTRKTARFLYSETTSQSSNWEPMEAEQSLLRTAKNPFYLKEGARSKDDWMAVKKARGREDRRVRMTGLPRRATI